MLFGVTNNDNLCVWVMLVVKKEATPPPPLPVSPPPAEFSPRDLSSSNLSPLSPRTPAAFMLDSVDSTVDLTPSVPIVPPPPRDLIIKTNEIDYTNQVKILQIFGLPSSVQNDDDNDEYNDATC